MIYKVHVCMHTINDICLMFKNAVLNTQHRISEYFLNALKSRMLDTDSNPGMRFSTTQPEN